MGAGLDAAGGSHGTWHLLPLAMLLEDGVGIFGWKAKTVGDQAIAVAGEDSPLL